MRQLISLPDKRYLWACFSLASSKSSLWLVYLPESGAGFQSGTRLELKGLVGKDLATKMNYLVINKPGLSSTGKDHEVFERSFRRRLRIEDALRAIAAVIPKGDRIFLVGYSEGAYLAPELALKLGRQVVSVAMIGGGTRGWLDEELSLVHGPERAALRRQVERIRKNSRSLAKWNGFSFATWKSYDSSSTLRSLRRLPKRLPVLSVLGARDRVIDFAAAEWDLKRLAASRSLRLKIFPRCGHSFTGYWQNVRREVADFLVGGGV